MKVFASLGARSVAFFIDALLLCVVWVSLVTFSGEQGLPLPWWSFIALTAIYFTALTASPWQGSLGKKSLSIKVTDLAGLGTSPHQAPRAQHPRPTTALLSRISPS